MTEKLTGYTLLCALSSGSEGTSVGVADIAAAWGVSRAYVYKLLKKGLDTSSLEAADAWRHAHAKHGVGSRSKPAVPVDGSGPANSAFEQTCSTRKPKTKRVRLKTLQDSLEMAIRVEELCAIAVIEKSQDAASQNFVNSYNKAHQNRVETEAAIIKQQKERGELITAEAATLEMSKLAASIISLLRSMPKQVALKANPSDEFLAESSISDAVETLIQQIQLTYARCAS